MKRENHQKDVMVHTMSDPFRSNIPIMSITKEKAIFSPRFGPCFRFETSNEPIQTVFIACPSFRVAIKPPVPMNVRRNPWSSQVFRSENDKRWDNAPSADT